MCYLIIIRSYYIISLVNIFFITLVGSSSFTLNINHNNEKGVKMYGTESRIFIFQCVSKLALSIYSKCFVKLQQLYLFNEN